MSKLRFEQLERRDLFSVVPISPASIPWPIHPQMADPDGDYFGTPELTLESHDLARRDAQGRAITPIMGRAEFGTVTNQYVTPAIQESYWYDANTRTNRGTLFIGDAAPIPLTPESTTIASAGSAHLLDSHGVTLVVKGERFGLGNQAPNSYTTGEAAIAGSSEHGVVVWSAYDRGTSFYRLFAKRYNGEGPTGPLMVVSDFRNAPAIPQVVTKPDGEFAVVYSTSGGSQQEMAGLYLREFNAAGQPRELIRLSSQQADIIRMHGREWGQEFVALVWDTSAVLHQYAFRWSTDNIPPVIGGVYDLNNRVLGMGLASSVRPFSFVVGFSEDVVGADNIANYTIEVGNTLIPASSAEYRYNSDLFRYEAVVSFQPILSGHQRLYVSGMTDLAGNVLSGHFDPVGGSRLEYDFELRVIASRRIELPVYDLIFAQYTKFDTSNVISKRLTTPRMSSTRM